MKKQEKCNEKRGSSQPSLVEASVVLARCQESGSLFGMRIQKMADGDWYRTWAFPMEEARSRKERYTTAIHGSMRHTTDYPGCPYCGRKSFVRCGRCGKLTCKECDGKHSITCHWCGLILENFTVAEYFDFQGGDI